MKTEEALKQSQKLFYQIFNSIPMPIWIITAHDKKYVEVNDIFVQRNGLIKEKILGQKVTYWTEIDKISSFIELVRQNGIVNNYEASYPIMTGQPKDFLLTGVAICWKGEDCILIIANDVTELRKYENEISHLSNLNLIGQMAASIAHEIRNPMTSVRGFLQLFQEKDRYSEDREAMDLIIEELDRVNDIITAFLSLAQSSIIDLKLQNLNDQIVNLLPLLRADAVKNDIAINTELNDVALIMIDEGEFRQMLLNLMRNGIEAMPEGGTLTIRTFEDRNGVNLIVEDKGHGIPTEVLKKIGTPFFTTKMNGTGLGLLVCYSIAERHNASINVDTSPNGTAFQVVFPAVEEA